MKNEELIQISKLEFMTKKLSFFMIMMQSQAWVMGLEIDISQLL